MLLLKLKYAIFFELLVFSAYSAAPETSYSLGKWICELFCPISLDDLAHLRALKEQSEQYAEGQSWLRRQNIALLEDCVLFVNAWAIKWNLYRML